MKILLTGFEPFGGETINPSWETVNALPDTIEGAMIRKIQLPTVYGQAGELLLKELKDYQPDIAICVGQAGGRKEITVERVAINIKDENTPDNAGNLATDLPISPEGQTAYFTTLPIKKIVSAIKNQQISASISNSAGTFVCNEIFYKLLQYAAETGHPKRCGFIHIPYLKEQTNNKPPQTASMSFETILEALEIAIKTTIESL